MNNKLFIYVIISIAVIFLIYTELLKKARNKINTTEKILYLIVSIALSFLIYIELCKYGKKGIECQQTFNQIKINNYKLHLHHWVIHAILLCCNFFDKTSRYYYIYAGLNIGGIIHGIVMYKNWYKVLS